MAVVNVLLVCIILHGRRHQGGGGTGDRSPVNFSAFNIIPMGVAWKESTSNRPRPPNRRAVTPPLLFSNDGMEWNVGILFPCRHVSSSRPVSSRAVLRHVSGLVGGGDCQHLCQAGQRGMSCPTPAEHLINRPSCSIMTDISLSHYGAN